MALTMQERQHVGREVALWYLRARKKGNWIMLQEFCATTGYSPPYAVYLLRTSAKRVILGGVTLVPPSSLVQGEGCFPTRPSPWPRQRKHVVGPVVVEALVWVEHLAGELCEGAAGSDTGTPACRTPPHGVCHHGPSAKGGESNRGPLLHPHRH